MGIRDDKFHTYRIYLELLKVDQEAAEYFWMRACSEGCWGESICSSFDWQETPQGADFWAKQHVEVSSIVGEKKFMWGW